jgi:hypothetical protein
LHEPPGPEHTWPGTVQSSELQHDALGMQLFESGQCFWPPGQAHEPPGAGHTAPATVQSLLTQQVELPMHELEALQVR